MAYILENLGDERFQQLCQSILVQTFPTSQCLPVGQPDGGRDAFQRVFLEKEDSNLIVFQVKFVKHPEAKDTKEFIKNIIAKEKNKVEKLIHRGVKKYFLLTNANGSSHLDTGSIDVINKELSEAFSIESHCWWRDDIERRLDNLPNLKWSYVDIIRGSDILQALIEKRDDNQDKRRLQTLKAYMAYQYKYDSQLKFKQIELQKSIIDLFVDVPARIISAPNKMHSKNWRKENVLLFLNEEFIVDFDIDDYDNSSSEKAPGALQLLISNQVLSYFSNIVLEGAPGQGKSTVTQFLCQIYRMILLQRDEDLERIDSKNKPAEARVPFRIDLRDYASWLAGRNPFNNDPNSGLPFGSSSVLESFIAAQVQNHTGRSFSVDDLSSISSNSKLLIVLDGFDEVADITLRKRIVKEVSDATVRLQESSLSSQVIVTSRPSAFANSPGFSHEEWAHIQLQSLSYKTILTYANKWLEGRDADSKTKTEVLKVLKDKLGQAHVRDLARNPMQLAILLALISVQGASLPDKRTALYDKYIDIFLNREAEKSEIVRDQRELLVQIHRFLAWKLQVEAESDATAGHITEGRLRTVLKEYLEQNGHTASLVDELFSGMVERVVALVSRVQGTFEFEVQPLREYFVARYLYDTAPYSPVGKICSGTLPERFDAIARNFYWLNVVRFYAGCYSSGELASLVSGLDELEISEQFRFISHVPQLKTTLLSDYVFSQQPKLMDSISKQLTTNSNFKILLSTILEGSKSDLVLPAGPATQNLVDHCLRTLEKNIPSDLSLVVSSILIHNYPNEKVFAFWQSLESKLEPNKWRQLGRHLKIFSQLPAKDLIALVKRDNQYIEEVQHFNRNDILKKDPSLWNIFFTQVMSGTEQYVYKYEEQAGEIARLFADCIFVFTPYLYLSTEDMPESFTLRQALKRYAFFVPEAVEQNYTSEMLPTSLKHFFKLFEQSASFLHLSYRNLREDLTHWNNLIEVARTIMDEQWAIIRLSIFAAELTKTKEIEECNLIDEAIPLCHRTAFARLKARNKTWWLDQLSIAKNESPEKLQFVLLCLFTWMPINNIFSILSILADYIDSLPTHNWTLLASSTSELFVPRRSQKRIHSGSVDKNSMPAFNSPRLATLCIHRLEIESAYLFWTHHLEHYKGDDREILLTSLKTIVNYSALHQDNWAKAINVIAQAYEKNIIHQSWTRYHRDRSGYDIPLLEAKQICLNPNNYPLWLIGNAESRLIAQTGSEAIPVGKIAARDNWFSNV